MIFDTNIHLADEIIKAYINYAVPLIVKRIKKIVFRKNDENATNTLLENEIALNISAVYNWSQNIEFIKIGGKPMKTSEKTTDLSMSFDVRRLASSNISKTKIQETDLLDSPDSYVILGDPGSGKSTTLKRVVQRFIQQSNNERVFGFALLIRFRDFEIHKHSSLFTVIAEKLGIKYETHEHVSTEIIDEKKEIEDGEDQFGNKKYRIKIIPRKKTTVTTSYTINQKDLARAIIEILEENKSLIILDGFDELDSSKQKTFGKEINQLKLNTFLAKILLTCRPGYADSFENFAICQICELNKTQISKICNLWVEGDTNIFLNQLNKTSYKEFANRPLFLCFLIILFNSNDHELPSRARDVYKDLINLFLKEWDEIREVERKSKYAHFTIDRKEEFLVNLAYNITFEIKSKSFTRGDLIKVYKQINDKYDLPEDEADLVAEEIENHTGIIVSVFNNKFEFSHLALQEYLCGQYITRTAFSLKIFEYLIHYPEPVAVAVAHSYESSPLFSNIIFNFFSSLRNHSQKDEIFVTRQLKKFIHRMLIEQPYFEVNKEFGSSILYLVLSNKFPLGAGLDNMMIKFIKFHKNIKESIKSAMEGFVIDTKQDQQSFYLVHYFGDEYENVFNKAKFPKKIYNAIL